MRITEVQRTLTIDGAPARLRRTTGAVMEIWAENDLRLAACMGFVHAHERLSQMVLVRLVAQGRMCECLRDDDSMLAIDVFMRGMGFVAGARHELDSLQGEPREFVEAYCRGVNQYLSEHRRPLDLLLARHKPEPWTVMDVLAAIKLMSYLGLAQSQQDMEKFLIQALQAGTSLERLQKLFPVHLQDVDHDLLEWIRRVKVVQPLIPPEVRFLAAQAAFKGSNNWVIACSRSASGFPVECHDPHLEVNRLPPVWYEFVLHTDDDYRIGVNMPGVPGMVMGRTRNVSLGFTYGFMDMIDYFLEDCRQGAYRRDQQWIAFARRDETILRRRGSPVQVTVFENELGVLETDPLRSEPPDGLHLLRALSDQRLGAAQTIAALYRLPRAQNVEQAQQIVREVAISCNWLIADRDGNIGLQQSGLLPRRRGSGLHPWPAWQAESRWRGMVDPKLLACERNPPEGFLATANHDLNRPDAPLAVNLSMGDHRVERIRDLLGSRQRHTIEDLQRMQRDVHSRQAEQFLVQLRPHLPPTAAGRLLAEWDLCYDPQSRAATIFEAWYAALLADVFGRGLLGTQLWNVVTTSTGLVADYFHLFDDCLLGQDESWFGGEGRQACFARILTDVLAQLPAEIPTWGQQRRVMMNHLLLGGRLPRWLGADVGPITLPGNRATIVQGTIYSAAGRLTTYAPGYRYISDLGSDQAHTSLAGGPSGNFLSRLYTADLERWQAFRYKRLDAAR